MYFLTSWGVCTSFKGKLLSGVWLNTSLASMKATDYGSRFYTFILCMLGNRYGLIGLFNHIGPYDWLHFSFDLWHCLDIGYLRVMVKFSQSDSGCQNESVIDRHAVVWMTFYLSSISPSLHLPFADGRAKSQQTLPCKSEYNLPSIIEHFNINCCL